MDNITASEVAGFGVGTLLLCATLAAPKIDAFFSASQRRPLDYDEVNSDIDSSFVSSHITACKQVAEKQTKTTIENSLGMCKRCGNLRRIACSRCKGMGSIKEGGMFGIEFVEDMYETLGSKSLGKQMACVKCQAKGYFSCPDCSKS